MLPSILLSLALGARAVVGSALKLNQQADPGPQFSSEASVLISSYIPSSVWASITASAAAVAAAESVTAPAAVADLVYSALEAQTRPDWLSSVVPTQYASHLLALESAIDALRATDAAGAVSAVPTEVVVTTTGPDGKPTTTKVSTTLALSTQSVTATSTTTTSTNTGDNAGSSTSNPAGTPTAAWGGNAAAGVMALVGLAVAL